MSTATDVHARERAAGFAFGARMFLVALPLAGLAVAIAPVTFARALGAAAMLGSILGLLVSVAGLRLEAPTRWRALLGLPSRAHARHGDGALTH